MKTVIFARHAKSDWNQPDTNDFERPLNQRGELDAPAMAAYLKSCAYPLQQIISSDAVRALATAAEYQKQLTPGENIRQEHSLYLASSEDILQVVTDIAAQYNCVMLVGHNPGMTDVVNSFAGDGVDDMSTCSFAIVQFSVSDWSQVNKQNGSLFAYEYPKKCIHKT